MPADTNITIVSIPKKISQNIIQSFFNYLFFLVKEYSISTLTTLFSSTVTIFSSRRYSVAEYSFFSEYFRVAYIKHMPHITKSSIPITKEKSPSADVSLVSTSIFKNTTRINAIKMTSIPQKITIPII